MRIPTIIDVAKEAGVSKSAAARALTGKAEVSAATVKRVREAAARLGYTPNAIARSLVEKRTKIIGVHVRDASNPFYAEMLGAMHSRAVTRDYQLISTSGTWKLLVEEELRALQTLVSLRVDGIVVCSSALPAEHIIPFAQRIPIVVTGRPERSEQLTSVSVDEEHGGRAMARHVVGLGHRRVGVVQASAETSMSQHARCAAMVHELGRHGAFVQQVFAEGDESVGSAVVVEVESNGLTAVMCPTNVLAVEVMDRLRDAGVLVPDDVSVTGYDMTGPLGSPHLGITSFRTPVEQIAYDAIDMVLDMKSGSDSSNGHFRRRGRVELGRTAARIA